MKEFTGNLWTETDTRGVVKVGFSQRYISEQLGECFHVIQADTRTTRKGQPLMVLETNDGTTRIKSPVSGTILVFADKARNFPDRITEDDVIVEILPEGVKLEPKQQQVKFKAPEEFRIGNWFQEELVVAPRSPAPPRPIRRAR